MLVGGEGQRDAIRRVAELLRSQGCEVIFFGACALALYAPKARVRLRPTQDVDCISSVEPWIVQNQILARMAESGCVRPDPKVLCRYWIAPNFDLSFDIVDGHGANAGGDNPWVSRAARRAREYDAVGVQVRAITPPYFLATKLCAYARRGPDLLSSSDIEDVVCLFAEVPSVTNDLRSEGIAGEVAAQWRFILDAANLGPDDLIDMANAHLAGGDQDVHGPTVAARLQELLTLA